MKKIFKEMIRHGAWIIILILILSQMKMCGLNNKYQHLLDEAQTAIVEGESIIKEKIDELGRTQSTVKAHEVDFKKVLKSKNAEISALRNSLKIQGVRIKNLKSYIKNEIEIRDTLWIPLKDTLIMVIPEAQAMSDPNVPIEPMIVSELVKAKKFKYDDKWLELDGLVLDDSVKVEYSLWEEHTLITHHQRKNIFSRPSLVMEFKSENPNAKLISSQSYIKKLPRARFSVGVNLGYGALVTRNGIGFGPYVGVGVNIPVITIYKR